MLLVGSIIIVWHSVAGVSCCVATAGVYTVASTWGLCCCWGVYIYIYFEASGIFKGGNHAFYGIILQVLLVSRVWQIASAMLISLSCRVRPHIIHPYNAKHVAVHRHRHRL